ncbi:MAG: 3-oxoacyl-ACP reductase FabG [Lentimicrobium sp.]|jgi:3-oxoacyl-[acyl-carrier protein] reductase|nr:3-oxoacyl-ACP reductase FabG [Lentimicrobium sp.]
MRRLENKVAIITGGADGIGKATALRFSSEGAIAIIWDLNEEKGIKLVEDIRMEGGQADFYKVNTSDYQQVELNAGAVNEKYGKIDILINNAGITRDASLKKMSIEQWQQVIDVNLSGVFYCTKAISPFMMEKGCGRIISTSSVVALYGNFGQSNYVATKAGVIGMTKTWARELGRKGITANAIAPGFISTEMVSLMPENVLASMCEKVPMGRLGKPEEIASAFVFLASDEAAYVNGAVLSVDGGITI